MTDEPGEAHEPHPPETEAPLGTPSPLQTEEDRYERERQERISRRNAVSWKVVGAVAAPALALLTYDSGRLAVEAHRDDRPWLYPAGVAAVCLLLLLALAACVLRRRGRGSPAHVSGCGRSKRSTGQVN